MKNFDIWNEEKKNIDGNGQRRFYRPREIWWCVFGINIGLEQDGSNNDFQRPVLILKDFSRETCLIVPLSTSTYQHKYRISIGKATGREAVAILSQMRVVDTKRLVDRICVLDEITFDVIRKSTKDML